MAKIDNTDKKIVDLLMQDGRMPFVEIARKLGNLTERAVRYRVARLLSEGTIQISAIPNPKAVGYQVVADVLIEVEPAYILSVAQALAEHETVSYVACGIGETDVSVQIVARSNEEVYTFVTEVIGKLRGVRKTTSSIVPVVLKDVYKWKIPASVVKND